MAIFWNRGWVSTKGTHANNFTAGQDLLEFTWVKESGLLTNVVIEALTEEEAIGFVISPKGALQGEKVDVLLGEWRKTGGGGGGSVLAINSIIGTGILGDELQLDGDELTPGPSEYYGTNALGVKGFYPLPGGGGSVNSVTGVGPNVFITGTLNDPIVNAGTQGWEWSGFLTTPLLNNYQNDYTQAGFADISTLKIIGDLFDPPIMTGFAGGTEGRFLIVHNASPDTPIYFVNQDPGSAANNQIMMTGLPGEFYDLPIGGTVLLRYDADVLKWRLMGNYVYTIVDDGNGVVTVTGGAANRTVGFSGVAVDGVTITGTGLPGNPLVAVPPAGSNNFELTYYVDGLYGNDGTAVPDSSVLKYQTIGAAVAAAGPLDATFHISPGAYSITSTITIGGWKKYYFEPGSSVSCIPFAFSINPGSRLEIKGYADIICQGYLFTSSNPTSNAIADVDIECDFISSDLGNTLFCDTTSIKTKIRTNQIFDMGFDAMGWFDIEISTDRWNATNSRIVTIADDTLYDGQTKMDLYGPRIFVLKGRTRMNTEYVRSNTTAGGYGLSISPTASVTKNTVVDLFVNFDTVDGFFISVAGGITRHYGNLKHRKSDTLGNEMPWLYCDQNVAVQENGPYFEHVYGDWVSATHPVYAGSLNNELASIRCGGTFVFNGRYKNSGENTGAGAWPVFQFSNANTDPGHTNLIFNGEIANMHKDAPLIQHVGIANPGHTFKYIFKVVTCEHPENDVFTSNTAGIPLYIYHSLTMNNNYSADFFDAMSSGRTIIDRDVTVIVPEYGL